MREYISRYSPNYIKTILYMLQSSSYNITDYLKWVKRTRDFRTVQQRATLDMTKKVWLLSLVIGMIIVMAIILALALFTVKPPSLWHICTGILVIILLPYIVAYGVVLPLWAGEQFVQKPRVRRIVTNATLSRQQMKGIVIAVAGSFGKTTFKESLRTILEEGLTVAATPGNKNTMLGTSEFITSLKGNEDVVICELGESHVGDVRELCELVRPDLGVITGINEAHLVTFGTIERTVNTIFELQDFLDDKPLYKNGESKLVLSRIKDNDPYVYNSQGVHGWSVNDVEISLHGTKFTASKKNKTVWAESKLIGEHQVGPLVACIDIADRLGLSIAEISEGIKETKAFEHRMQPYSLNGATIIDDTYNGNVDGIMAGLKLLKQESGRRIYVTPGLVEHGDEAENVHQKIGIAIADSADLVILMKNSVTAFIESGLAQANYQGELMIVDNPLKFYENLEHFVAKDDVVLMQNDWTDNYS